MNLNNNDYEIGDKIETKKGTYILEQCPSCKRKYFVADGTCDVKCPNCNFKMIDCG